MKRERERERLNSDVILDALMMLLAAVKEAESTTLLLGGYWTKEKLFKMKLRIWKPWKHSGIFAACFCLATDESGIR
jgi:hypothetical protein